MSKRLHKNGIDFLPSHHGFPLQNHSCNLKGKELQRIKEEAFTFNLIPAGIIDVLLKKTLASGVCSGISAYTLTNFLNGNSPVLSDKSLIYLYQARTWGRPFVKECIKNYFSPLDKIVATLEKSLDGQQDLLLVILPKVFYFKNIYGAHTIIPYGISKGLTKISIRVFDSNYPGDDRRTLIINKTSQTWYYDGRNEQAWVLTVNKVGNLTQPVPFLL